MGTRAITTAILIIALTFAAGCGDDDEAAQVEPGVRLDEPGGTRGGSDEGDDGGELSGPSTPTDGTSEGVDLEDTTGTPRPVIAATTISSTGVEDGPVELQIDVYRLERSRDVVQLEFQITNHGPGEYRPSIHLGESNFLAEQADGLSLIDYAQDLRYLTLIDEAGDCVCSGGLTTDLGVGDTFTVTAAFPAPPAGSVVDIALGTLGNVPNVTVTDA